LAVDVVGSTVVDSGGFDGGLLRIGIFSSGANFFENNIFSLKTNKSQYI
jgi:hypothetical protein